MDGNERDDYTSQEPQMAENTWEEDAAQADDSMSPESFSMQSENPEADASEIPGDGEGNTQAEDIKWNTEEDPRWSDATQDEMSGETAGWSQEASYQADGQQFEQENWQNQQTGGSQQSGWGYSQNQYQQTTQETKYGSYEFTSQEEPQENLNSKKKKEKKARKQKRRGGAVKGFFKCVGAGVVIGAVAFGVIMLLNQVFGPIVTTQEDDTMTASISTTSVGSQAATSSSSTSSQGYDIASITEEVMPSVVAIACTGTTETQSFFGTYEQEFTSSGSGVIVGSNDSELLIATNNHVISDAEEIVITFADDTAAAATVKGKSSDMDLAIVAVKLDDLEDTTMESIKIATLGDSDELKVGETVIAIGNALGYGQSVTCGIVSALNREVTITTDSSDGFGDSSTVTAELIQTDAAINPGNSGGPLFNTNGEVVGINSVKYASDEVEGMGYAIPITEALPILEELMNMETKEKVEEANSGYLGITGADVTSDARSIYGMPEGAYVVSVTEGSAAEKAGIQKGDIIVSLGGTTISSMEDLQEELLYYEAGTTVEIVVARNESGEYEEQTLFVTLDEKPKSTSDSGEDTDSADSSSGSDESSNDSSDNSGFFGR